MRPGVETFQHFPVGHGPAAVGCHRHFFAVGAAAADGGIHRAHVIAEIPGADSFIRAREGVVGQLGGEKQVGRVVFGGDDES